MSDVKILHEDFTNDRIGISTATPLGKFHAAVDSDTGYCFYAERLSDANEPVVGLAMKNGDGNLAVIRHTGTETIEIENSNGDKFIIGSAGEVTLPGALSSALTITTGGLTVTAGGITITAGGLTVTAGGLTVTAGGIAVTAGLIAPNQAGGAASANALLMGVGTSASPATTAVASKVFVELRTQSSATSGDSRCLYMRHDLSGAAGGGESLRSFTKVSAACSTARGAHISVDLAAAGSLSGFGAGVDAQVMLGGAAYSDTLAAANLELYGGAGATITGTTSMLRLVIQGDATAVADIEANAFLLDLSGVTAGASGFIDTDITALTGYGSMKVKCPDGTTRYIAITTGS